MSLSLDISALLETAFTLVNQLFPAFTIPIALSFAVALLGMIIAVFLGIFGKFKVRI